eukprot:1795381-Alexandrium_andersonii.AAC.1
MAQTRCLERGPWHGQNMVQRWFGHGPAMAQTGAEHIVRMWPRHGPDVARTRLGHGPDTAWMWP